MDALTAVIVDDDTLARDRLGQLLTDAGVRVLASLPDGLAALAWFRTPGHEADAAFVDIQMPQMDGLEATRRLRSMGCEVPIVALTANAMTEDRARCLAQGMNDFLAKPISLARLRSCLLRHCRLP